MLGAQEQRSEVARLLSQISDEYEAAQRGLHGLSYGVSQHESLASVITCEQVVRDVCVRNLSMPVFVK